MTAETFTQGPWLAETNEKSACVSIYGKRGDGNVRQSDGLGRLVTVDCALEPDAVMFSPMNAEDIANAHLIASAPDLFEALEMMQFRASKCPEFTQDDACFAAFAQATVALAKARGES